MRRDSGWGWKSFEGRAEGHEARAAGLEDAQAGGVEDPREGGSQAHAAARVSQPGRKRPRSGFCMTSPR